MIQWLSKRLFTVEPDWRQVLFQQHMLRLMTRFGYDAVIRHFGTRRLERAIRQRVRRGLSKAPR